MFITACGNQSNNEEAMKTASIEGRWIAVTDLVI